MKIVVFGCLHGSKKAKRAPLKGTNLILIAGDLGKADLMREMYFKNIERKKKGLEEIEYSPKEQKRAFMEAYDSSVEIVEFLSSFAPVYMIYGNVEISNKETKKLSKEIGLKLPSLTDKLNSMKNVRIINNKFVKFKHLRIGGVKFFTDSCWVREFKPKDYSDNLKKAKKASKKVEEVLKKFKDLDIFISHQPPYGILDRVTAKFAPKHWKGKNAGSKVLLNYVEKKKPKFHLCAHIHEGKGRKKIGKTEIINIGSNGDYVVLNID
ncbi:MAG: metallophosphoesterase [Candidatus Pacearchaeota archaeon]